MSSRLLIYNGRVLLPSGELAHKDILITNGIITEVKNLGGGDIDAQGGYVLPGLIDLHMHGLGYESASHGSLTNLASIAAERGATTFYPTLFAPADDMINQLLRHREESGELKDTPQVAGFRLESPYIHHAGGGMATSLHVIDKQMTELLLEAGGGHIKIWDISPELQGAPGLINDLSAKGIICSLAHTYASIEEARKAVDAGARLVTHLFDTFEVPAVVDPGVYPAGLVDYLLVEDRLICEIIGDGTHVHPLLVEKAFRCKGRDGVVFITDSNLGSGLPPGEYTLPGGWGNIRISDVNNGVRLAEGNILAGSALTPIDMFRNAVRLFGRDIATASNICSTVPAGLMGLNKGLIKIGYDADLIILDDNFNLLHTISSGEVIYKSTG